MTTAKKFMWATLLTGSVVLALWYFMDAGDDRPPIIIGDGSINIWVDHDEHGKGRGRWDQATGAVWLHAHDGRPTQRFDVSVLDGTGTDAECTDPDQWVSSTDLSITYDPGGLTLRVWIDPDVQVGQRRAIVDFGSGPSVNLYKPYWLRIPNSAEAVYALASVSIREITTGRTVTCGLGADGQVKVYQRKK
jgi:hypothetical protein